ncbi:hypothetical protein LIER_21584 [Lithospermum erythrorhizon]|uniref:F-box/kelch-repeat protein SKIP25 n=1 Tax=Lithospermum erythrorhizon TaxID=34254 RepID=A0AAV3QQP9_LITER
MRLTNFTTATTIQTTFPTDIIPTKRPKTTMATHHPTHKSHHNHPSHQSLLPGLPDHIAQLCLSLVPPYTLSSVCNSWRQLIYSPTFPPFLSIYSILLPTQTTPTSSSNHHHHNLSNAIQFASFDPVSSRWHPLPPLPLDPPLRLLPRHPSFISRNLPVQSVTVSGNLILLAATADQLLPALSRPLIFNPINGTWTYGPALFTPRRWCASGSLDGVVYVASGIGSHYNPEVARSVEKWDLNDHRHNTCLNNNDTLISSGSISINNKTAGCSKAITSKILENSKWGWEKISKLRDAKFSREAIDAIGWRGKLCMVNVKGDAAKEGIIYNVKNDSWEEMPEGMLLGWRGPAAAMDEEVIFSVDESKGLLKRYHPEMDGWSLVVENVMLKGAQSMAVGGGRACVVCGGGGAILVVDVVTATPRVWVVEAPQGFEALDVHILPRMKIDR